MPEVDSYNPLLVKVYPDDSYNPLPVRVHPVKPINKINLATQQTHRFSKDLGK